MTTEQQTRWTIGQTVSTADAEAMPVGTVLHAPNAYGNGYSLTKQDDGRWLATGSNGYFRSHDLTEDYNTLVSLPASDSEVSVGQVLQTDEQIAAVPVGGVIRHIHGSRYRRTEEGYYSLQMHVDYPLDRFDGSEGAYTFESLPEATPEVPAVLTVIRSHDQMRALPIGSVLIHDGSGAMRLTKTGEDEWTSSGTSGFAGSTVTWRADGWFRVETVASDFEDTQPEDQPEWATVGAVLQMPRDAARDMPVGSILRERDGVVHTKVDDIHWARSAGPTREWIQFSSRSPQEGDFEYTVVQVGPASEWTIGMALDREQIGRLPLGAVIRHPDISAFNYEKREDNWYSVDAASGFADDLSLTQPMRGTLVRLPSSESEVPQYTVGQRLTNRDDMLGLPVGAVIRYNNGGATHYTVLEGQRLLRHDGGARYSMLGRSYSRYSVVSLPDGTSESEAEADLEVTETFEQYVQRFRVTVFGAAQGASVSLRPLHEGMRQLDVPEMPLSVGMFVNYYGYLENEDLPAGTTAVCRGENDSQFAILGWTGGGWRLIAGDADYGNYPMKVVSMPGHETEAWVTQVGTQEDARRIESFKRKAWDFGVQAKSENSWCGVYERTMAVMGIEGD